ncbi:MAG: hypothetical protein HY547_09260 [Elusimicrobia bacterium]|nr:hypothetical protein [Elusimicrobiota bacterium]
MMTKMILIGGLMFSNPLLNAATPPTKTPAAEPPPYSTELEEQVIAAVKQLMANLKSVQEEYQGLIEKNRRIEVGDLGKLKSGLNFSDTGAVFGQGKITISRPKLQNLHDALINAKVPGAGFIQVMAIQFLPALAHEAKHALNKMSVGAYNVKENEFSAYLTQIKTILELRDRSKRALSYKTDFTYAWNRLADDFITHGPGAIWYYLDRHYDLPTFEELARQQIPKVKKYEHDINITQQVIGDYDHARRECDGGNAGDECRNDALEEYDEQAALRTQGQIQGIENLREADILTRSEWLLWRNPEQVERAALYFADEVADADNLWQDLQ